MKITLNVTRNDIKRAKEDLKTYVFRSNSCPVARAFKRTKFCKDQWVGVTRGRTLIGQFYYFQPDFVTNWIINFDEKKEVEPFKITFKLEKV